MSSYHNKVHTETSTIGMVVKSSYKDWDLNRIAFSESNKKESGCDGIIHVFQYNYKLSDGSEIKRPLLVELPSNGILDNLDKKRILNST
jgi:hypothetical protein